MTTVSVSLIDALVLRGTGSALEVLLLQRGPHGRCPGSWEVVHGQIMAWNRVRATVPKRLSHDLLSSTPDQKLQVSATDAS